MSHDIWSAQKLLVVLVLALCAACGRTDDAPEPDGASTGGAVGVDATSGDATEPDGASTGGTAAVDATGDAPSADVPSDNAVPDDAIDSSVETCPSPSSPPTEGSPCPMAGLDCPIGGGISCPLRAKCDADGFWQITCPTHAFENDAMLCG